MTSWDHVSLKMTQMDGFKSFKTAISCHLLIQAIPKKSQKLWDFCYVFLSDLPGHRRGSAAAHPRLGGGGHGHGSFDGEIADVWIYFLGILV